MAVILLILLYLIFFGAIFLGGGKAVSTVADFITNLPELYRTQIVPFFNWISGRLEIFWRIRTLLWPWRYRTVFSSSP